MGAHFSPCGRFLVACVACLLPQTEGDRCSQLPVQYDSTGPGSSPTRHPLPSHRVIYELRVYSLEKATYVSSISLYSLFYTRLLFVDVDLY
jgi:activating molecule in BECN1-regulated autophagy protein 1